MKKYQIIISGLLTLGGIMLLFRGDMTNGLLAVIAGELFYIIKPKN